MKISSLTPDLRGGRLGPLVRNGSSVTSSRHFQLSGLHSCSSVLWLHATKNLGTSVCFRRISPCNFALETSLTQFSDNGDSSVFWPHQIFIVDSWSSIYRQYRKVKEKKQDDKCQEISLQNLTRTLKIIKKKKHVNLLLYFSTVLSFPNQNIYIIITLQSFLENVDQMFKLPKFSDVQVPNIYSSYMA